MISGMSAVWEGFVTDFLTEANDSVIINYKPVRSGSNSSYDSFFNESVDSSDPDDVGVSEVTPATVSVKGKTHLDLYGASMSSSEDIQKLGVGSFEQADALFTCLLSVAIVDNDLSRTVFDECDYVDVEKDAGRYEIKSVKRRGMGQAFLIDVFLKKTNK